MSHPVFLVVDDDAILRLLLQRVIAIHYPYAPVYSAASVTEARLDLLKVTPTIVLADYHLQDGTALDVLAAVRVHASEAPVVVVSSDDSVAASVLNAGAHTFLSKPFDVVKLQSVLAGLCVDKPLSA